MRCTISFFLFFCLCLFAIYFSTKTVDSQTEPISSFHVCFVSLPAAVCAYIHITSFHEQCLCSDTVPRNAEKDLLTTLSSCCNSMRAGMQQKERNRESEGGRGEGGGGESRKDREREIVSGISRSW